MQSKEMFLSNTELSKWWSSIASDSRFDMVLLYASGCAIEAIPSAEQREGALRMKDILLTIANKEADPVQFVKTGLSHDLEPKSRALKPKEEKKK
jgi:hypothetical protein